MYTLWPKHMNFAKTAHDVCSSRLYRVPSSPLTDRAVSVDPSSRMEGEEQAQAVRHAVSLLPEMDRMVLKLTAFEGMDQRDVSACLAMPRAKVNAALARARSMLKARLA